jgi:hypothetical protein
MSTQKSERHTDSHLPDHLAMLALESHFKYGGRADWRPHAVDALDRLMHEHVS